ncbi:hypothetical protein H9Q74_008321 [Fusarium xylarioides]|nr:hypothetical protein H9Q71_011589 [Fusarium xylarioides]KAG5821354.1 hypothetical protein H9Q74_008321 [Fusarium xylarioides]
MADLDIREPQNPFETIREGIIQRLKLEAQCKALEEGLSESEEHAQKLEARMAEMAADHEGLMKLLAEKDALIERYSALMSETLDKTVQRERQDLRDVQAKVFSALDQLDVEMSSMGLEQQGSSDSGTSLFRAKGPGLVRQGAIVPGISTSDRRSPRNGRRVTVPRLLRQDAQMYGREDGEGSPESDSLLEMARHVTIQKPRQGN